MKSQVQRRTILIVDDDAITRTLLRKALGDAFNTAEAGDGQDALDYLDRHGETAAVLLDLHMPGLDGYQVLERMLSRSDLDKIPVVVITASEDEETQEEAFRLGALDVIVKPFHGAAVRRRVHNIVARMEAIHTAEESKWQNELTRMAETDSKTGLWNKQTFCRETEAILRAEPDCDYVLARWDFDRFKVFNDTYGMAEGDRLLAALGKLFQQGALDGVIPLTQGHYDADHFVSCWKEKGFDPERFCAYVEAEVEQAFPNYSFVTRFGFYHIDKGFWDVGVMCDRALLALRSVKNSYEQRYAWYGQEMRQAVIEEQEITLEMKEALAQGQFIPYFQPQYNYVSGRMLGAEALVRWKHPRKGLISPGKFIPIFEKNGFIFELDRYMWEQVCSHIRSWLDQGLSVPPISVNVSRRDMYHPQLRQIFLELLEKYGLDSSHLRLEITESAYVDNPEQLIRVVGGLRESGFHVEMDDFGSGYSSLNTLKDVPVDTLKMDMKFVAEDANNRGGSILSSVVRMAHSIKLPVIAEGVESKQQAEYLKSIGCLYMQGFLFAHPMKAEDFTDLMGQTGSLAYAESRCQASIDGAADFLNATTQSTLLFNSFVGGAAILEYSSGNVAALRLNDRFFEVLGVERERYLHHQYQMLEYLLPESRLAFVAALETAIHTDEEAGCEICCQPLTAGGEPLWLHCRLRCLARQMGSYLFYLSIEDISQRKKLSERQTEMGAIIDLVPGGIFKYAAGEDDQFSFVSDTLLEMLGYEREEFQQKFDNRFSHMVYHQDLAKTLAKIDHDIAKSGNLDTCEYRIECKDGTLKWVYDAGRLIHDENGKAWFIVVVVDMDERKKLEEELALANSRLAVLIQNSPGGILCLDIHDEQTKVEYFSDGLCRLLGYSKEELADSQQAGNLRLIHPEDMPRLLKAAGSAIETGAHFCEQYRILHKDGVYIWVVSHGNYVRKSPHSGYFYCSFTDVSHIKQMEERLLRDQREIALYQQIADESDNIILIVDMETMELLFYNDAAAKAIDSSKEALSGMTCHEYFKNRSSICENCHIRELGDKPLCREAEFRGRRYTSRFTRYRWNGRNVYIQEMTDCTEMHQTLAQLDAILLEQSKAQVPAVQAKPDNLPRLHLSQRIMGAVAEHSERIVYYYSLNHRAAYALDATRSNEYGLPERCENPPDCMIDSGAVSPDCVPGLLAFFDAIHRRTARGKTKLCLRGTDEKSRWFDLRFSAIEGDDGRINGAVLSFLDISSRHEQELSYARYLQTIGRHRSGQLVYLEADVNADLLEKMGGELLTVSQRLSGTNYTEALKTLVNDHAQPDEQEEMLAYYSREHLLTLYADGQRETGRDWLLHFRRDKKRHWVHVELQLVADPYCKHIKVFALLREITAEKEAQLAIERRAQLDGMTGLYNRSTTEELIRTRLATGKGQDCVLILLDLDNLKEINDTLGHEQGDKVLQAIAKQLREHFRDNDIIGRFGGDEFLIFLSDVNGESSLRARLVSLIRKVSTIQIDENSLGCFHCSAGCSLGKAKQSSFEQLFHEADTALYHVKRNGKNDYAFYAPQMQLPGYTFSGHGRISLKNRDQVDPIDIHWLIDNLANFFPLIISVNQTRDTFYLMESKGYMNSAIPESGAAQELTDAMGKYILPAEQEQFYQVFSDPSMHNAYASGQRGNHYLYHQLGDDGSYHTINIILLFYQNEKDEACEFVLVRDTAVGGSDQ